MYSHISQYNQNMKQSKFSNGRVDNINIKMILKFHYLFMKKVLIIIWEWGQNTNTCAFKPEYLHWKFWVELGNTFLDLLYEVIHT